MKLCSFYHPLAAISLAAVCIAAETGMDDPEYRRLMQEVDERLSSEQTPADSTESAAAPVPAADSTDQSLAGSAAREENGDDTLLVLSKSTVDDILTGFDERRRSSRERGYGGGLGAVPGLYGVDMKPVRKLVENAPELQRRGFDIDRNNELMLLMGGMGYGGVGNGVRIGGGGRGGSISYSNPGEGDTIWILDVGVGFGGVLVEKAFVAGRMNFFFGGMVGAGSITVTEHYTVGSGFSIMDEFEKDENQVGEAKAAFMLLEFHGGFTYTLLSWLHIGVDLSGPFFISTSGFKSAADFGLTDGFTTFNPGGRLRLILGNLG